MKDAYYFSHDSNARNDEKILSLRMDLGMEGYGIFWSIIEMLRDSNNYKMRTHYERIAFELHVNSETVKKVINDYELFTIEDDYFFSESLLSRMKKREEKSQKARESALNRWNNTNVMRTHSKRNAIKVNESKRKEIKDIPSIDEFLSYAKTIEIYKSNLDFQIKTKYKVWVDNGWCDGNGNKIDNWKNKLRSVMPYMKQSNVTSYQMPPF